MELGSSSSYSFDFRHLPFNGIMKETISSLNITDPIGFCTKDIILAKLNSTEVDFWWACETFYIFGVDLQELLGGSKLEKYTYKWKRKVKGSSV